MGPKIYCVKTILTSINIKIAGWTMKNDIMLQKMPSPLKLKGNKYIFTNLFPIKVKNIK